MITEYLKQFKNLEITKSKLAEKLGSHLMTMHVENPMIIRTTDVINLLEAYQHQRITLEQLIDWVNMVWFTDLFEYADEQCDAIASVLDKLEELDEEGRTLTESDIHQCIRALKNNQEL